MDFASWVAEIKSIGGVPVTWPVGGEMFGQPAARFTRDAYARAQLSGVVSGAEETHETATGEYVYVLYVDVSGQPHTMTSFERAENAVFTAGDATADAIGLPSLDAISTGIKLAGVVVVGAIVLGLLHEVNAGTSR